MHAHQLTATTGATALLPCPWAPRVGAQRTTPSPALTSATGNLTLLFRGPLRQLEPPAPSQRSLLSSSGPSQSIEQRAAVNSMGRDPVPCTSPSLNPMLLPGHIHSPPFCQGAARSLNPHLLSSVPEERMVITHVKEKERETQREKEVGSKTLVCGPAGMAAF